MCIHIAWESDSSGLEWVLRVCVSSKLPVEASDAHLWTTLCQCGKARGNSTKVNEIIWSVDWCNVRWPVDFRTNLFLVKETTTEVMQSSPVVTETLSGSPCRSPTVLTAPLLFLRQVPAELHSRPQSNPLLPRVPPDLHPAREGGGRAPEQLLHHKPDGRAAANSRQQCWGVLHPGDSHRCGCREASLLPKPRWECKWADCRHCLGRGAARFGEALVNQRVYTLKQNSTWKMSDWKHFLPVLRLFCLLPFSDPIYLNNKISLHCADLAQIGFPRRANRQLFVSWAYFDPQTSV